MEVPFLYMVGDMPFNIMYYMSTNEFIVLNSES